MKFSLKFITFEIQENQYNVLACTFLILSENNIIINTVCALHTYAPIQMRQGIMFYYENWQIEENLVFYNHDHEWKDQNKASELFTEAFSQYQILIDIMKECIFYWFISTNL